MKLKEIQTANYITKSNLPDADYVINPYTGCAHKCNYCYAEFMKRFTGHTEEWGEFIDVKHSDKPLKKLPANSTVLVGSVTDAYQPHEKKFQLMRPILEQLATTETNVEILTKSDLVLRDIDLLSKLKHARVGISLNTLDDEFRQKTEPRASSVQRRLGALKGLKEAGISTYLFMSPIFPEITKPESIIDEVKNDVDFIGFENLNLRGGYMPRVLDFIAREYPEQADLYNRIYKQKDMTYWEDMKSKIIEYCEKHGVDYRMYFYHDMIKKNKKQDKSGDDGQLKLDI